MDSIRNSCDVYVQRIGFSLRKVIERLAARAEEDLAAKSCDRLARKRKAGGGGVLGRGPDSPCQIALLLLPTNTLHSGRN